MSITIFSQKSDVETKLESLSNTLQVVLVVGLIHLTQEYLRVMILQLKVVVMM